MTDEGELKWILGMRITRDRKRRTFKIDQSRYVQDLIDSFDMTDCKLASTPAIPGATLPKIHQGEKYLGLNDPADKTLYRTMVGKLAYAMVGTRPDIAFAVSQVARHFENPTVTHLVAAKRIIRYIKGTVTKGLQYDAASGSSDLLAYCDSDWGSCPDTRRSTSGYIIKPCGGPVAWLSKRQPTVALSSAEAEYMCAAIVASEVLHLRQMLRELDITTSAGPTTVYCDSQSAMHMIKNPTSGRAKHIDIKLHFVKGAAAKDIQFQYVGTDEQLSDVMTKALARPKFYGFMEHIVASATAYSYTIHCLQK
jgi:hypothetical protein